MAYKTIKRDIKLIYPLVMPQERILVWRKVKGMWKRRKPDPARELSKMRKEWERV